MSCLMLIPFVGAKVLFAATIVHFEDIASYSVALLIAWISLSLTAAFLAIIYGSETMAARREQERLWTKVTKMKDRKKYH